MLAEPTLHSVRAYVIPFVHTLLFSRPRARCAIVQSIGDTCHSSVKCGERQKISGRCRVSLGSWTCEVWSSAERVGLSLIVTLNGLAEIALLQRLEAAR